MKTGHERFFFNETHRQQKAAELKEDSALYRIQFAANGISTEAT